MGKIVKGSRSMPSMPKGGTVKTPTGGASSKGSGQWGGSKPSGGRM